MPHVSADTSIHSLSHMLIIQLLCRPVVSNHHYPHVMFRILAAGVVAACVFFPAGVPEDTSSGFPTQAVKCFLFFTFYRCGS